MGSNSSDKAAQPEPVGNQKKSSQERLKLLRSQLDLSREAEQSHHGTNALRLTKKELLHFAESSPMALHWLDHEGFIQWANQAELDLLDCSKKERVGQHVLKFHVDPENCAEMLRRIANREKLQKFPARLKTCSGQIKEVLIDSSLPSDKKGKAVVQCFIRDITAEKSVQDARQFLAAIVESSDDAIITKNLEGIITSWNKGAEQLFGYTAKEAIGQPVLMLIPEDRQSEEPNILARLRRGERIEHFETIRRCKDGRRLDISLTISPVRDHSGNIIGASKIARDITERKRADSALRERTQMLESLNRVVTTLAGELDLEKLVQAVTDAGREISGAEFGAFFYNVKNEKGGSYTLYTLSGAPREAFSKFPMPRNTPLFEPTFNGEGVVRIADVLQDPRYGKNPPHCGMPEGHLPVRSYLAVPVISRSGEVVGGLFFGHSKTDVFTGEAEKTISAVASQAAIAIDNADLYSDLQRELNAHKAIENALRDSEARFRALIDNSLLPIWVKDCDGVYMMINKRYEEIFNLREAEVIGKTDFELHPPEIAKGFRNNDIKVIDTGQPLEVEENSVQPDGPHTYIAVKFPLRRMDGSIYGVAGIGMDITERKRNELEFRQARENLARANEDLEKHVQERTATLREVIGQMEEFSYSVSHDLRAPVRAMKGYAIAAMEDYGSQLDARGRDYLDRIIRSSNRMESLIHDVLTYSRLARTEIVLQPVSLGKLLQDVIQLYPALQPPRAEISIREPLHTVLAHEPSLTQAISNLLSNGVKFVAPGTIPMLQIWTEARDGKIRLWIKDNGIGIKPEYQRRLFGMFERVHQDRGYEGTGIGLAIVRKAAEKMGGSAGVDSDGIQGSSFWIELPAANKE